MCVNICSVVISCQIYLNNNTDIPKCKWSRKCWGFLFWTLTSFTSHQSSSSIWLPDKWFFSRHYFGLDFKIGHFFKLCIQLHFERDLAATSWPIISCKSFLSVILPTHVSTMTNSIRNYFWKNVGGLLSVEYRTNLGFGIECGTWKLDLEQYLFFQSYTRQLNFLLNCYVTNIYHRHPRSQNKSHNTHQFLKYHHHN